jgi:serine protease Do
MSARRIRNFIVILAAGTTMLAAAFGWPQRYEVARDEAGPTKSAGKSTGKGSTGTSRAQDISAEFRRAATAVLPGIVSIETYGQTILQSDSGGEAKEDQSGGAFDERSHFRVPQRNGNHESVLRTQGHASGFVIDSAGVIMTSAHVLMNADRLKVKFSDGREFVVTEAKGDPRSDIAILRIKPRGELHALRLGDSDAMEIGDCVLAVGSPFGLDLSVTAGIISAKHRGPGIAEREDFLQTDAAVNPGNSGGPLVNLEGEVIGVNSAIATRSGGYEGISFAVPIDSAKWVGDQLASKGAVTRAYLGIATQSIDEELARQFKLNANHDVIVTHVVPHSPAVQAKLEAGDVILRLDGKAFHRPRDLVRFVERLPVGHRIPLVISRHGKEVRLDIEPRELPVETGAHREQHPGEQHQSAALKFEDLGLVIGQLSPDIARQLGYGDATGAAVLAVEPEGVAAQAGLQPGMMIERVGPHPVTNATEFRDAVKGLSLDDGVALLVRTPRGSQFVVLGKAD